MSRPADTVKEMRARWVAAVCGLLFACIAMPARATPPAGSTCSVFPADNVWHADVSNLPVHSRSTAWVNSIGSGTRLHPDFGPSGLAQPYGIPYDVVAGSHAKVSVAFDYSSESDHGLYPIGSDTTIEMGSDRHALIVDKDSCTLYELYALRHDSSGWHAGSGAIFDLSSNALRPSTWTSADAAGLSIFAGLLRRNEVASGNVDHAIRFTANHTSTSFLWPARHQAGDTSNANVPPMGARFRLKSSFNISGFRADTQTILRAMKKHGMLLADNGADWYFGGASEDGWNNDMLDELKTIPAAAFEAVDESSLMVDANSGVARTGPLGSLTLGTNPSIVTWPGHVGLSGTLACQGTPVNAASLAIARTPGAPRAVSTDAGGAFASNESPSRNTDYRATWTGGGACTGGAFSVTRHVLVRVLITMSATDPAGKRGSTAELIGRVLPSHAGKIVMLQSRACSTCDWVSVARTMLSTNSWFRFHVMHATRGARAYRALYTVQDSDHFRNSSAPLSVLWS